MSGLKNLWVCGFGCYDPIPVTTGYTRVPAGYRLSPIKKSTYIDISPYPYSNRVKTRRVSGIRYLLLVPYHHGGLTDTTATARLATPETRTLPRLHAARSGANDVTTSRSVFAFSRYSNL
jgi:hypothetical protein